MDCSWPSISVHGIFKNTGVGCHFLFQGTFPTQGSNPCLLHCRWILYHCATGKPLAIILVGLQLSQNYKSKQTSPFAILSPLDIRRKWPDRRSSVLLLPDWCHLGIQASRTSGIPSLLVWFQRGNSLPTGVVSERKSPGVFWALSSLLLLVGENLLIKGLPTSFAFLFIQ